MKRTAWMREAIAAGKEFHVMRQDKSAHNRKNLLWTAAVLTGIGTIVLSSAVVPAVPFLLLAPWMLGSLFFSLFILVIHECSHDMFILTDDKKKLRLWNRRIGQLFSAPFFTDYVKHWEEGHLVHHLRPCEADDPQDRDPITGWPLAARLLVLLTIPVSVLAFNPSNQYGFNPKRIALGVVAFIIPAVLASVLIAWPAGIAVFLGMHVLQFLALLKKAQEHGGGLEHATDPLLRSRTYLYPLARFASPFHINYHFEHHANFRVPWYHLPAYHARLKAIVPEHLQPWFFHSRYIDQAAGRFPPVDESLVYTNTPDSTPENNGDEVAPAAR